MNPVLLVFVLMLGFALGLAFSRFRRRRVRYEVEVSMNTQLIAGLAFAVAFTYFDVAADGTRTKRDAAPDGVVVTPNVSSTVGNLGSFTKAVDANGGVFTAGDANSAGTITFDFAIPGQPDVVKVVNVAVADGTPPPPPPSTVDVDISFTQLPVTS